MIPVEVARKFVTPLKICTLAWVLFFLFLGVVEISTRIPELKAGNARWDAVGMTLMFGSPIVGFVALLDLVYTVVRERRLTWRSFGATLCLLLYGLVVGLFVYATLYA